MKKKITSRESALIREANLFMNKTTKKALSLIKKSQNGDPLERIYVPVSIIALGLYLIDKSKKAK